MPRPLWKGNISFGLVYIPVTLFPAIERLSEVHFHLMDNRSHARIRYKRINEETGKEVPWEDVTKAYEFEKGNYVTVDEKELEQVAAHNFQTVEIEGFVDQKSLESIYFDKPYYLVPGKQGEKGYLLLLQTLIKTQKMGIAKVVIKTKQHLAALLPYKGALVLNVLRFAEEIRDVGDFELPKGDLKKYAVSSKEIDMAERLVASMSLKWNPKKYHDESRKLLQNIIKKKIKGGKAIEVEPAGEEEIPKKGKVIDFMDLLKRSVQEKEKRTKERKSNARRGSESGSSSRAMSGTSPSATNRRRMTGTRKTMGKKKKSK